MEEKTTDVSASSSFSGVVKVAKVIAVHQDSLTVDVQYLDGVMARQVPVLSGALGTTHGFMHAPVPSFDQEVYARKTYPDATGTVQHSPTNTAKKGRDQYCVVLQMESLQSTGHGGAVVAGFFAPEVSEMLFPRDEEPGDHKYADFLLFRHPSDVQITIDAQGKMSQQHPSGSRVTIGQDIGRVNLAKKDYDALYELRENLTRWANYLMEVVGVGAEQMEPEVQDFIVALTSGNMDEYARLNLKLFNKIGCHVRLLTEGDAGNVYIHAPNNVIITNGFGCWVKLLDTGDVEVHAANELRLTAGAHVQVSAPRIDLN